MPITPAAGRTIPALPCISLDETLTFWNALGFRTTYKQKAPNHYAVLERDDWAIHFYGLAALVPTDNFSCCLAMVPADVAGLHAEWVEALRTLLGRAPLSGMPRVSRFRPGQTRFTVTDPSGNSVMFIEHSERDMERSEAYKKEGQTVLQKAIHLAARARDFHHDDVMAARVLNQALKREPAGDPLERAQALAARAELAAVLGEQAVLEQTRAAFRALPISAAVREKLRRELSDPSVLG